MNDCTKTYVGSTISLSERYSDHMSRLKHNRHINRILQRAYNKYGISNMSYEICEIVELPENSTLLEKRKILEERETFHIKNLGSDTYNIEIPGKFTKIRKNIKELIPLADKHRLKGVNKFYNRKSIVCYSLMGDFIKEYSGIIEASKDLNIIESSISRSCTGEQSHAGSYIFRFKNFPIPIFPVTCRKQNSIYCNKNGKFYKEFKNMNIAQKELGIPRNKIHYYCNSKNHSIGEYSFHYTPTKTNTYEMS